MMAMVALAMVAMVATSLHYLTSTFSTRFIETSAQMKSHADNDQLKVDH